jgi:hypothetical protein
MSEGHAKLPRLSSTKREQLEANPAAVILLEFREGRATNMLSLFWHLGLVYGSSRGVPGYPHKGSTLPLRVKSSLTELVRIGLLEAEDPEHLETSKIRVTEWLSELQQALDLSLTFLASFDQRKSMAVKPLFGLPETLTESLDVFVLMPFKADMLPVYEDHIKPTCTNMELNVRRGDDFFTADSVVQDIWKAIASARLIVADCTDRNPNVFYEIGVAHTIGKPTILITQKSEDVPFDLRHLRYIPYQLTPRGMKQFEEAFEETVRNVLDIPPWEK